MAENNFIPLGFKETSFPGLFEVQAQMAFDDRGVFIKLFREDAFEKVGLPTHFGENYSVKSTKNIIRGLHFQTPPHGQGKLVYCTKGKIIDVGVDLRKGSPTYGQHFIKELDSEKGEGLYLPIGFAHGYLSLSDETIVTYASTDIFYPENDDGIRWNSAGIDWPIDNPTLSTKDAEAVAMEDYDSPFLFENNAN
jgi:dTDP-4-dehydrorhamnose 3,5-epimerase